MATACLEATFDIDAKESFLLVQSVSVEWRRTSMQNGGILDQRKSVLL